MLTETAPSTDVAIRPACRDDSRRIAELVRMAADGVADYIWSTLAAPGEDLLDFGERRYAREGEDFSYRNAVLAERDGAVIGFLLAFAMPPRTLEAAQQEIDPVLRPYAELEVPGSLYIAGIGVQEGFRRQGIATRLLTIARERARTEALYGMSAIVFAANTASRSLFQRQGFTVIDRRTAVPHPLIRHTGEALLYHARP
ncbi:MAG TPA: GNAT family N-acetyltransferase [Azospirillum sp.]|nr:GNAT family N-acetyltransferase [Azospirillum sp.]